VPKLILPQHCSNSHGRLLAVAEYGGSEQNGFVVKLKGKCGRGWLGHSLELPQCRHQTTRRNNFLNHYTKILLMRMLLWLFLVLGYLR
jgi:hypothetical protein